MRGHRRQTHLSSDSPARANSSAYDLSRLDLATAHLHATNPDLQEASALAVEALTLTADQRFESVHQRARQFLAAAHPFARHPRLRHVADLLADRAQMGATARTALPSLS